MKPFVFFFLVTEINYKVRKTLKKTETTENVREIVEGEEVAAEQKRESFDDTF